ncbi:hypothetical protein [Streptomyces sp. NPDC005017]
MTLKPGSYEIECPVDGHKDRGMKTEITVGGGSAPADRTTPPGSGY